MPDLTNIVEECSQAWITSILGYRRARGLANYETNQIKADPIAEEVGEGEVIQGEKNFEKVKSDDIYVDRLFDDENKTYDAYNS